MSTYTRALLKQRVNAGIKGKLGVLIDANETLNQSVRSVLEQVDLRSTRRMVTLQPGVFNEVFAYPSPVDIKAQKLVSLAYQAQQGQSRHFGFNLVPYEEFVHAQGERQLYSVAFDDQSGYRRMLIAAPNMGISQAISSLDFRTSGGGMWGVVGGATNLVPDSGNRIIGSGSLKFDINASVTTEAGIVNSTMTPFDLSLFLNTNNSIFVFAYLSDPSGVNGYRLRLGTSDTVYYEFVANATHINTAFVHGWNLIRFDAATRTEVGVVDPMLLTYGQLVMLKEETKISQTSFRFDHLVARSGDVIEVRYYSKYGWQNQSGVWLENSTADDDYLNADTDEFEMIVDKAITMAGNEVDEGQTADAAVVRFDRRVMEYEANNPSQALLETTDYMAQHFI